ncbi:hypothetical protein LIZ13_06425 [Streptococcus oralis]|uniref:hypothetical protein n=1 Tax=Streptococcus oralis TaxID=1303 RepID=UPI001D091E5A|nr:hypothetical protein [Streptococcus oralis]MCB7107555.1 hypothetical protein [Streptococcus oralis]MCQ5169834.1 hypothetical protein [Streptococcus oralis]
MTQQYNNFDHEIDWEGTIEKDSDRVLLPDGLYYFTVVGMERTRHTPNPQNPGKLPACNKAIVSIKIVANEGEAELRHNLFLHSSTEGMLSAFFAAIGQKRKGEPLRMDWNSIVGKSGVCKVGVREYNGNKYNEVKGMIYAEDVDYTKVLNQQPGQATQASYQQSRQPQQQNFAQQPQAGYQAGQF